MMRCEGSQLHLATPRQPPESPVESVRVNAKAKPLGNTVDCTSSLDGTWFRASRANGLCTKQPLRGITLIELMVVISLAAILASLAAPSFRDFVIRNRSAAMANEFIGTVMRARNEAVSRNTCVVVCRSALASNPPQCATDSADWRVGWMAFVDQSCSATTNTPTNDDVLMAAGPFDAQFSFISNAPNSDRFMFGPSGTARAGDAGSFDLQFLSATRPSNRRICLSALGRARVIELGGGC